MELGKFFVLVLACILLVSGNADAKIKRGEISTEQDIAFMDHFYFQNSEDNVLNYSIKYPADQCCYRLVIFDESNGQWGSIRPNEDRLTCRGKINRVKDLEYKIKLTGLDPVCHVITDDNGFKWLVCQGTINFESRQRAQNYFVHLTNCRSNRKGLRNVSYSLHMTNGNNSLKEFAENQKFMMETDLAFFLGYVVMTIVATRFRYVLSLRKLLHLTYRLFYSSLFFKTVCLLLLNIDLSRFARTGLEMTTMQHAAEIFSWLSTIFFVCVLLLVSKGFSITRAQISIPGTVKTIVFGIIYLACYTIVFFDQRVLLDPQDIIVSMTSLSASGLIGLKLTGAIIFVYGCLVTIKNHPRKVLFYLPFTIFFSVWFVAEPTYRLLSLYVYPVLKSPNIWNGIDLAMSFAGHAYFLFITRPDRLNKRFPFHLRAGKVSFRDIDEDVEDLYIPSKDFYSIFQTGMKSDIRTGTTLTIPEGRQHFQTPVLPFNAHSEECLAVLPRPSSPEIPTVSATVDLSYRTPSPVIPTVSGIVHTQTHATSSVFVSMPSVVAKKSLKITPAGSPTYQNKELLRMKQIPKEDDAAVGISTVFVPKGGFSIFSVQKQPDTGTSPVSDYITTEHKETYREEKLTAPKGGYSIFSVNKQPELLTFPKNPGKDVTDQTQNNNSGNKEQASGNSGYSFLPQITSLIESTVSFSPKTIKRSGSDVQLTHRPLESRPATYKPNQEPLKTKTTWDSVSDEKVHETRAAENLKQIVIKPVDDSNLEKDTDESRSRTASLSQVKCGTSQVRLINIRPAPKPNMLMTTGVSQSANLPDIKSHNNGDFPKVRVINVKSVNEPYMKITSTREPRSADQAARNESSTEASSNTASKSRLITVSSADKPLQNTVNVVSAARIQKVLNVTNEAIKDITSVSNETTVSGPNPSSLATDDVLQIKNIGPLNADPLKRQFPIPRPKIQNWTTELLEQSKSHLTNSGQGITSEKSIFDPGCGSPSSPQEPDIASRSEDLPVVPAANGGDFSKPSKKTQKEPSKRRFPKSTNLGTTPDTSSNKQQMAMDPKTKKKKLKRFLKLARRHKNKPAKAE